MKKFMTWLMCSMLIFLSACSEGAETTDPVSSGSPEVTASATTESNDSQSSIDLADYITDESLSWDEILEGVGSTSAEDALVNNSEATKQFLENWVEKEKNNNLSSLMNVKFHNPEIYFPNEAGANCIFEMDIHYMDQDKSIMSTKSTKVQVFEDNPELFIFEFMIDNMSHAITSCESLPTFDQSYQFMNGAKDKGVTFNPNIIDYDMTFDEMVQSELGLSDLDINSKDKFELIANYIAEYWKNNGYTEVNITYDEGERSNEGEPFKYTITAVIPDISRIKGMITFELEERSYANFAILEHCGYLDRYSNEYVQIKSIDGQYGTLLCPASETEKLIKEAYEIYLESEEFAGGLTEFD